MQVYLRQLLAILLPWEQRSRQHPKEGENWGHQSIGWMYHWPPPRQGCRWLCKFLFRYCIGQDITLAHQFFQSGHTHLLWGGNHGFWYSPTNLVYCRILIIIGVVHHVASIFLSKAFNYSTASPLPPWPSKTSSPFSYSPVARLCNLPAQCWVVDPDATSVFHIFSSIRMGHQTVSQFWLPFVLYPLSSSQMLFGRELPLVQARWMSAQHKEYSHGPSIITLVGGILAQSEHQHLLSTKRTTMSSFMYSRSTVL